MDKRIGSLLPGYMTMGHEGMAMGRMAELMPMPANTIPMKSRMGPFGEYLTSGGMFTLLKVRNQLKSYEDPGWYQHPPGTVASKARAKELARDGIDVNASTSRTTVAKREDQRSG